MAPPAPRRSWTAPTSVALVNLLLGVPGVVPLWLAWYWLSEWPLAGLGITRRDATNDDGWVIPTLMILPVVLASAGLWWLIGSGLRRRLGHPPRRWFWPLSVVASLLPTLGLIIAGT